MSRSTSSFLLLRHYRWRHERCDDVIIHRCRRRADHTSKRTDIISSYLRINCLLITCFILGSLPPPCDLMWPFLLPYIIQYYGRRSSNFIGDLTVCNGFHRIQSFYIKGLGIFNGFSLMTSSSGWQNRNLKSYNQYIHFVICTTTCTLIYVHVRIQLVHGSVYSVRGTISYESFFMIHIDSALIPQLRMSHIECSNTEWLKKLTNQIIWFI